MSNELLNNINENKLIMLDSIAYFTRRIMYAGAANINKNDVSTPHSKTYLKNT